MIVIAEVKSSTMEWSREFGERMEVDIVDYYADLVYEILLDVVISPIHMLWLRMRLTTPAKMPIRDR